MRCVGADLALQRPAWGAILTVGEAEPTEWGYAGGFVDGEGCIAVPRSYVTRSNRFSYGVCVVVCNRDRSVLEWMKTLWGGWVVSLPAQARPRTAWNWRSPTGLSARPFLTGVRPWLRIKGPQADNALVSDRAAAERSPDVASRTAAQGLSLRAGKTLLDSTRTQPSR